MGLLEDVGPRGAADVAVEHDDPGIVVGELGATVSPKISRMGRPIGSVIGLLRPAAGTGSPRSAMAVANSSGLIARVCQK